MKKLASVLTIFTTSVFCVNAQVQFGLKGGANFANVTNSSGGKTMVNFNGGALVKIPLADALSLQPEAVYSRQGIKADDGKLALDYINIPVLLTYTLPVGVFFQTGPQLGILLSAKAMPDSGSTQDLKSYFKSTDFAWAFGAGYLIPNVNFGFNVRYNLGISNLGKYGGTSKNSVFQVGVFYLFSEGNKK
ncbi:MAG: PorT family protein [Chitinophagaceae bacterium]|nr:PorT family protein [Chitinophagaceae bacterium]